jgi:hypothetical protein
LVTRLQVFDHEFILAGPLQVRSLRLRVAAGTVDPSHPITCGPTFLHDVNLIAEWRCSPTARLDQYCLDTPVRRRDSRTPETIPVPVWHREILDERLKDLEADPGAGDTWDVVQERLRKRFDGSTPPTNSSNINAQQQPTQ